MVQVAINHGKKMAECSHLELIKEGVSANTPGECEECVKLGDSWVHLRMCLICGKVGCCNSSKNKHATAHFKETGHPLIQSAMPGESWRWCYIDQVFMES